ncbi:Inner membrane protein translocase component YidC, long form [invertebrate metagenome]|uniref:Membrane protein insertase YidC n=1 Tax=invertebrate metagenome TaxID=1711999 RepID=A0A484H7M7_9ZZZZ
MSEQRNVILAVSLSLAIILVFQLILVPTDQQPSTPSSVSVAVPSRAEDQSEPLPLAVEGVPSTDSTARISISTPSLHGSIALIGGRIDTLTMVKYHLTPEPYAPEISLLTPPSSSVPYYVDSGWAPVTPGLEVPDATTRWTADSHYLGVEKPVTLTWTNKDGVVFSRKFSVDSDYMFTVHQKVENHSDVPLTLAPYQAVYRYGTPQTAGMYILHEGPLGLMDGTLREKDYKDLKESGKIFREESEGGWAGITDKYWLVALVPPQNQKATMRFLHQMIRGIDVYQVDHVGPAQTIAPGHLAETVGRVFAGAKEAQLLDYYATTLGIRKFDLAIDFGWFSFLTRPFFHALTFLRGLVGNFGVAILLFTVLIKALVFPLANKSYQAMSKMKKLQPELKKLQERFRDDRVRLNQEMMALYKREKINPAAGCLPILIQIPIFFALYKVLFITIEMRHAPFFGWIQDLSAPDPTSLFNLFSLIPWTPPALLQIGVWPLVMGVTMWLQQRMNPQPADPVQARVFAMLPIVFTVMLAQFSAGLVIYWAWNNVLSILQQWVIMKRMGVKL